ncbi:MAG: NAD(P)-binding protein [Balneolaceae bacterium]|nr:NAD(P)-binding protein [Balneolaceae bacterium]
MQRLHGFYHKGYQVSLFEKRDKLGGRLTFTKSNGFTFDGGPTVITAPFLFDEIFEAAGKKAKRLC